MAFVGQVSEFNESDDNIIDYLDRVKFYLIANDVESDIKKRAILLTVIGKKQFRLLKDLCVPHSPEQKSYEELCTILKNFHAPPPPKFLQRAKFDARSRQPNETFQSFLAAIKNIAEFCQFGDNLQERLCEKFVTGINDHQLQRKFLSEPELTLETAVKIASSFHQTRESAQQLSTSESVNYASPRLKPKKIFSAPHPKPPHLTHTKQPNVCYRCSGPHNPHHCKFKSEKCFRCGIVGHISKCCRKWKVQPNNKRNSKQNTHLMEEEEECLNHCLNHQSESHSYELFSIKGKRPPVSVMIDINGYNLKFQVDTGASCSVITKTDFENFIGSPLEHSAKEMRTYTGELVKIHGEAVVTASYKEQTHQLTITVVDGDGPPLMGRDWLQVFKLDWNSIFSFSSTKSNLKLDTILERNCDVFQGVGLLNDREVKIHVKEGANPKFCKARQPPFMMREKIEKEIDRLEKDGIVSKVTSADWASPIVPVLKKDNSVRICGDYKSTLNKAVHTNQHPIPLIEDLAQKLAHGKKFTELDFSHAYTQLKLHPSSRQYTTVNTHKGLYEYNRLCFGISSSPGIFQSVMESLFQDIPNCCVYFDNLYVTGRDDQEHLETLDTVLKLIKEKGLKLRREKCQFFKEEINFLGHCLSSKGLRPQAEKVRAIREAPEPTNRQQLQSFLGLVNYFAKFIPNLSQSLAPLYSLLKKNAKWQWNSIQESSFRKVKAMLTCDRVLCHYDPNKKLILTCDASPDGVGAILAHVQGNEERPIAFASRSLSSSEKNYSQLDREALAIVFAVRKFHKFIFGRRITIFTDHKPLLGLFAEDRQLPIHASIYYIWRRGWQ